MDEEKSAADRFDEVFAAAQTNPEVAAEQREQLVQAMQGHIPDQPAEPAPQQPDPQQQQAPQQAPQQQQTDPMQVIAAMQRQMSDMAQQNQQLMQALRQQSAAAEEQTVQQALTPPELDLSNLWAEDENVVRQRQREYADQMADFVKGQIMSELSSYIEDARQGRAEREEQQALAGLAQVPELSGIMGMAPTLKQIIETNPAFANSSAPIEDKLITAYAFAKGADALKNPPKAPTADDFMQMYRTNPDIQKQVEQLRAQQALAAAQQTAPPMSAGAGAVNAPLTPPKQPKDFDEMFRLMGAQL